MLTNIWCKKVYVLLVLGLHTCFLLSQINQHGNIVELNSSKMPVPGVQLLFYDAVPTDTDNDGRFIISFADKKYGDLIVYDRIYKEGFELVNEKELRNAKLSDENLEIIMCKKGLLVEMRIKYYNISLEAITAGYRLKVKELKKLLTKSIISESELEEKIELLTQQKEEAAKMAAILADQFSRINFDDEPEQYKKSLELFQSGDIDGAIELLEKANLTVRIQQRLNERTRIANAEQLILKQKEDNEMGLLEDISALELEAKLYEMKFQMDSAQSRYQLLWLVDTMNMESTFRYAHLLRRTKKYDLAISLFEKVVNRADKVEKANAYLELGYLYREIGNYSKAFEVANSGNQLYDDLFRSSKSPMNGLKFAETYSLVGLIYQAQGKFEFAFKSYSSGLKLIEKLNKRIPNDSEIKFEYAKLLVYAHLMSLTVHKKEDSLFEKYCVLMQELNSKDPNNIQYNIEYANSLSVLGSLKIINGQNEDALKYYDESYNMFLVLSETYPENESIMLYMSGALFALGSMNQFSVERKLNNALAAYLKANKILKKMYAENPHNFDTYSLLGQSYNFLGWVCKDMGEMDQSLKNYKLAYEIIDDIYQKKRLKIHKDLLLTIKQNIKELDVL